MQRPPKLVDAAPSFVAPLLEQREGADEGLDALATIVPAASCRTGDSHIRLRVSTGTSVIDLDRLDADDDMLDDLSENQILLELSLAHFASTLQEVPEHLSSLSPYGTLHACLCDLGLVRDALAIVQAHVGEKSLQSSFAPKQALSEWLLTTYAWANASLRGLEQLAANLYSPSPDEAPWHWRIDEAKNLHLEALALSVRHALAALTSSCTADALGAASDAVFDASRLFEARLGGEFP